MSVSRSLGASCAVALVFAACSSSESGGTNASSSPPVEVGDASADVAATPCTKCGSTCVDTKTNRAHCGGCYQACSDQEVCESGKCKLSSKVVLQEIHRTGVVGQLGSPRIWAVLGNVLHYHPGLQQAFVCQADNCAATATQYVPSDPSMGHPFDGRSSTFPPRPTPRGFYAGGRYYTDGWLRTFVNDVPPAAAPFTLSPYALDDAGALFWACANKQPCATFDGSTQNFALFHCASGACSDLASATPLRNVSCKAGPGYSPWGTCMQDIHVLRTSPGKEWIFMMTPQALGGTLCVTGRAIGS